MMHRFIPKQIPYQYFLSVFLFFVVLFNSLNAVYAASPTPSQMELFKTLSPSQRTQALKLLTGSGGFPSQSS
ncbi:MAG: hypothetical protein OEZ58_18655, partial [Gammaproteobacteria bacterium]|nr:hypothetical protein [Gammaproteobacteria bacterium]